MKNYYVIEVTETYYDVHNIKKYATGTRWIVSEVMSFPDIYFVANSNFDTIPKDQAKVIYKLTFLLFSFSFFSFPRL